MNTASAYRAANSLPSSDEPAWTSSGWPCGERGRLSGPRTRKYSPGVVDRVDPVDVARRRPPALSPSAASSSQLSHSSMRHVDELGGALVALAWPGCVVQAEVAGGLAAAVVTMFQPARPPLMWSSEANLRARLYGSL